MKRILALVFLSAALVACGGGSGDDNSSTPPVVVDPAPIQIPVPGSGNGIFDEAQYRDFVKKYDALNPGQIVLPEGQTIDTIPLNDLVVIMSKLSTETPPETI